MLGVSATADAATLPDVTCPVGRKVEGAVPAEGGCVCRVMEMDQARADPILEGAPVGVFVTAKDDPHTFFGWCAGTASMTGGTDPRQTPDYDRDAPYDHFSACPIFQAAEDWNLVERLFALDDSDAKREEALAEARERGLIAEDNDVRMIGAEEAEFMGEKR